MANLKLGPRLYDYIRSFLSGRRARLRIGSLVSGYVPLGHRGTPLGSVISPVLFNLCMIGLSKRLASIYGIKHTMYADDITL